MDDVDATIVVTINGNTYADTNNGDGTWTLPDNTITPALTDGAYDVEVRATDLAGNSGIYSAIDLLTIDTTAPVVTVNPLDTNDSTPELTGTVDDVNATIVVKINGSNYTATNNGDGTWTLPDGTITLALTDGVHDVVVIATDNHGSSSVATATITVDAVNDAPTVDVDMQVLTVDEGAVADTAGSFSEINQGDTVEITASISTVTQIGTRNGTWAWSCATADGPDQNQTVTITATDGREAIASATFDLVVVNVAPTLVLDAVTSIDENGTATLTGTITDPGILDTFTLDVNWGDPLSPNNVEQCTYSTSVTGSQTFTLTHQYLDDNPMTTPQDTYTISATVTDDDTGTGSDATAVQVGNVVPTVNAVLIRQSTKVPSSVLAPRPSTIWAHWTRIQRL